VSCASTSRRCPPAPRLSPTAVAPTACTPTTPCVSFANAGSTRAGSRMASRVEARWAPDRGRPMSDPARLAADAGKAVVPSGSGERFAGYGVMGLSFASGHVLAMRRFPASSVGPAYTSVWHREPDGRWVFWQGQQDDQSCLRYFSAAVSESRRVDIELSWSHDSTLRVAIPGVGLVWTATLAATGVTRVLNAVGRAMPNRAWRAHPVLTAMGPMAGFALRAGKVGMVGTSPNGQESGPARPSAQHQTRPDKDQPPHPTNPTPEAPKARHLVRCAPLNGRARGACPRGGAGHAEAELLLPTAGPDADGRSAGTDLCQRSPGGERLRMRRCAIARQWRLGGLGCSHDMMS
jgi:hypothetical protein